MNQPVSKSFYNCKHFDTSRCPNRDKEATIRIRYLVHKGPVPIYKSPDVFDEANSLCADCTDFEGIKKEKA